MNKLQEEIKSHTSLDLFYNPTSSNFQSLLVIVLIFLENGTIVHPIKLVINTIVISLSITWNYKNNI